MRELILLLLAAIPLMGSPGPATLSLAATGAAFGTRRGLPYLYGIVAGTTLVLFLIATGVTGLLLASPVLVHLITAAAAIYILYLAYRIATAPVISEQGMTGKPPGFRGGLALAVANPKAFAAIGAVYSGYGLVPAEPVLDAIAKLVALTLVIVLVNTTWLALGSAFSAALKNPRAGRAINVTFALLLVFSVASAVLAG
ncbi:LysE family translocator [Hoeflea poritis]|uniref:LysE family transporter n=1 Tax=Hoeflea poritis TaxID=2993659 RepID=A0ABT4VHF3_9HYPH|nr:LysE family transporter [Hoeflea poritis]MDA4844136.1 LysE family transporter [Hoeflea poritis]